MKFVHSPQRRLRLLFLLSLAACSHPRPGDQTPAPIPLLIHSPDCDLPALPEPIEPQIVGFPTPDEILVSKSDMADIIGYVTALNDWIRAANACLQAAQQ